MNIDNLRIFCLVLENKSISKAAQISYISQPGVTRQIRALEDYYGLKLFNRKDNNKITATEAGFTLYSIAKAIINDFNYSIDEMNRINGEYQFTLNVGASLIVGEYLLPKLFGEFKKQYPEAQLSLKISNTKNILKNLSQDIFHIGIVEGEVDQKEFQAEVFAEDELILVTGPDHPWALRKTVDFSEIKNEQSIRREAFSETRVIVEKELKKHIDLDELESFMELETTQAIKSAVEVGLGIAFLSRIAVEKELEAGRLIEVKTNNVQVFRPLYVVKKKTRFPHLGTEKFFNMLMEI